MTYRYPTIKIDGKTKLKHRHIKEQEIGRPLRPDEHVHHVNEQRFDCRPANLEVKDAHKHSLDHAEERRIHPREKPCDICGSIFKPHPTKRKVKKTCSTACANRLRSRTERATKLSLRCNVDQMAKGVV